MAMAPIGGEKPDSFSYIVKELIDRYGDIPQVLDSLSSNMGTFIYAGSVLPLYQSHIKMLEELKGHSKEGVRMWAIKMIAGYEKMISRERDFEEEQGFIVREVR